MEKQDALILKSTQLLGKNTRRMTLYQVIEHLCEKLEETQERVKFLECLRSVKQ